MDLDKAKEIVELSKAYLKKHGTALVRTDHIALGEHPDIHLLQEAQGFIEGHSAGHASRDPEVADLKKDLALNASLLAKQCDLAREAEGEVEKLNHEIECLRIQHRAWTDSFGTTQLTHALAAVQAEREASRQLVSAFVDTATLYPNDPEPCWCRQNRIGQLHFVWCVKNREALKFYATPGHSPEGKTL